MDTASCHFNW